MPDIRQIAMILLVLSPFIILGLGLFFTGWTWTNPSSDYTKFSVTYVEIENEMAGMNPFNIKTNLYNPITIKNNIEGNVPIDKIRISLTGGMDTFHYIGYGNLTVVELQYNSFEINLNEKFHILRKRGDILILQIQVTSEHYKECTITIQGGVT